jgi:2-methylisocitrate lyase-like PEP mutase family enzyme
VPVYRADVTEESLSTLAQQAETLRVLHHGDRPLVLPNVWDAASARIVAAAGFPAIATGSAPIATSLGFPDHEGAPRDEMLAAARRITGAVDVPVSVDVEAGYGFSPAELVRRLIDIGAAGCNIEDSDHWGGGLIPAETQANRLAAVRSAATAAGVPLVINARVDVFIQEWGEESQRLAEALRRAVLYLEAGADCVYPILVSDRETISQLTQGINGPVNVLYRPGTPSIAELGALGVARVTFGPGLHRATMAALREIATRLAEDKDPY